jgi:hypothetical protein
VGGGGGVISTSREVDRYKREGSADPGIEISTGWDNCGERGKR